MDKKLRILIIGNGGREHAIGWKIAQSKRYGELFFAPGNAGTRDIGINVPIKTTDISALIDFAKKERIDLTLAIPDGPLAAGVVDEFKKEGLRIFGPTKGTAQIESSKAYAKHFMRDNNLPTALFQTFTDFKKAEDYVRNHQLPIVIKTSGLAMGKGVFICEKLEDAIFSLEDILVKKKFGEAGNEVVIEEFLIGSEISVHAFTDGKNYSMFPISKDYKRIGENDKGLNTGGMGTICPVSFVDDELIQKIKDTILAPTLVEMEKDMNAFSGVIYPGVMITTTGPKILEYNSRFGDPETQSYMRLLETDLLDIVDACIDGKLDQIKIVWKDLFACTIVIASLGYPESYEIGKIIDGIKMAEENKDVVVFHACTTMKDGNLVTNGGRVLGVSAVGKSLDEALAIAHEAVSRISFDGMQYRKDIGKNIPAA